MFGRKITTYSDEELMQFIASGDQQAFTELYRRYQQRLYYYFFRMLGNSDELANDFLQEVFLKVIEKPERFNPDYSFKTWIFSVAHNLCKNEYRRREVRNGKPLTEHELPPVLPESISQEELLSRMFASLDELSNEHRSVFLMHYREGFPVKDIAAILDIAPGTVKSRLFNTRKFLADKFQYLKDEIEF
ncbi:RNA polymerase sigma factor [Mangrovibacterium lignilyticum]|uniref:RNA polymerase sigma factor n=1 Tax=Mangrovibacterium lignilyticum TaxID=2668052 RepID=UPI0013D1C47C|nr:RNA polymerase sigma factor [Mangrovibacterium lignilyticum]